VHFSDEAWFTLRQNINSKKKKRGGGCSENPHAVPLHNLEVRIWCAVSANKITGPMLFEEIINYDCCI
jgi:hypothetical protein